MKKILLCWITVFLFLIILGVYLLFLWQKGAEKETAEEPLALKTDVYQEITGFSFSEYISGKKKMEIKAEKASIKPKRIAFFKTPLIKEAHMVKPEIFFFTDGKEASHIMADAGKMNMNNKRMFLKGGVILVTADGKRLSTKEMAVDPKNGLLSIEGRFTLKRNGDIIRGKGLKSDIGLKKLEIKKR